MSSNPNTTETFALLLSLNTTLKRSMLVLFYVILNIGWSQMSTIIPAWEQALDLNFSGNILDLALSKLHFCTCMPSRCVQTGRTFRRSEYEVNTEMGMKYICPEWVKLLLHKLCILVIIFPTKFDQWTISAVCVNLPQTSNIPTVQTSAGNQPCMNVWVCLCGNSGFIKPYYKLPFFCSSWICPTYYIQCFS